MIALFLAITSFPQASWHIVDSPVNEDFVSVSFIDAETGWILSRQGTLLKTDDEGETWETVSLGAGTYKSVCFTSSGQGFLVGYQDSSFIQVSVDGGENWVMAEHPKAERLNDVYFHDDANGWVVGIKDNKNYDLFTPDGGQTWIPQMDIFVMEAELMSVSFRDASTGNACGLQGAFYTTNSGGTNGWSLNISIPSLGVDLYGIHNWGPLNGCAVGSSGTALYTSNLWGSYTETTTNTEVTLYGVSADQATNRIWAVGEEGTILYTPMIILGWTTQSSGVTETLKDIQMLSENNGWAVGDNGTILHYTTGTSVKGHPGNPTFEVYPNPAKDNIFFIFNSTNEDAVEIEISDMTGKVVSSNFSQLRGHGDQRIRVDISSLPKGVYLYRLIFTASDKTETGKLIVN